MVVDLLAYIFGIDIGKELVGERGFRVCEVLGRGCGEFVEVCISSLVSSIEALLELSATTVTGRGWWNQPCTCLEWKAQKRPLIEVAGSWQRLSSDRFRAVHCPPTAEAIETAAFEYMS
jgi:hypothetical protein